MTADVVQVLDRSIGPVLAGLLHSPAEATADAMLVLEQVIKHVQRIAQAIIHKAESDLPASVLASMADNLKIIAQQGVVPAHLQQAGMQELLISAADDLLKAKSLPAITAATSQHEGACPSVRYQQMDVDVEEI